MLSHRDSVPINVTYYREYGIYPVKGSHGTDYIASFPNWGETITALKSDLPRSGNVITPEYTTAPDDLTQLHAQAKLINDRIKQARDLTGRSDATLHLGTPTTSYDAFGRPKWLNSVLSMRNGKIESATHKTTLVPVEEAIGISEPIKDLRTIKNGNAVLICAELFGMFFANNKNNVLRGKNIRQILAPTMWATPQTDNNILKRMRQEAGGDDNYYRQQLEHVVGSYVLRNLPTVNRIIVSDRGRPDIAPYNAVFDRIR